MPDIKVSVSCVTYNQEKYIKDCLDSLVCQITDFDYEIIVHDDASTDSTSDIVREYEAKYPQIIKAIYEKENVYSISPRMVQAIIFERVQGKYIAFCEGDDYWCDNRKLQKQYEAMERNQDCTVCVHKVARIHENGTPTHSMIGSKYHQDSIIVGDKYIKNYYLNNENEFQTSSFFIRKDVLFSMPKRMNEAFFVGDIPMLLWSLANGNMYYIDSVSSCYRVMASGSTNQKLKDRKYAFMRLKTSVDGNIAFDEVTGHRYWEYMKHEVMRKKAQMYYFDKESITVAEKEEAFSELSLKERWIARVKFTSIGNILRNLRQEINSRYD